eukprot:s250_g10.t12
MAPTYFNPSLVGQFWTCESIVDLVMLPSLPVCLIHGGRMEQGTSDHRKVALSVAICKKECRWESALRLLEEARPWPTARIAAVNDALSACERSTAWIQALSTVSAISSDATSPSVVTWTCCMSACSRKKSWLGALELLRGVRTGAVEISVVTCNIVTTACERGHQWQLAVASTTCMAEHGFLEDSVACNAALSACNCLVLWGKALALLAGAGGKSIRLTEISYNTAEDVAGAAGRWQPSLQILQELFSSTLRASPISFNTAITGCSRAFMWQRGLSVLGELALKRLTKTLVSLTAAMSSCAAAGRWAQAAQLLAEGRSMALEPTAMTLNALLSAYGNGLCWQRAVNMLEDMVEDKLELDQVSYNIVLDACGSAGMWQLAWHILRVMWQRKISANAISFNSAMAASAKEDLWEQGLHLLGDMASRGVRADAVTCSAALNTLGWERVSTLLARASREVELDAIAFNAAMGALSSAEQWQDALFLHQETPELRRQLPNAAVVKGPWLRALAVAAGMDACRLQTDLRGTGAVVSSTEKGWRWQPALQLLQAARLQTMQASTIVLSPVASACEKSAQWQSALGFVVTRRRYDAGTSQDDSEVYLFNAAISACEKSEVEWVAALQLLALASCEHVQSDVVTFSATLSACGLESQNATPRAGLLHCAGCLADLGEKPGKWRHALDLLGKAEALKVATNLISLNAAVSACHKGEAIPDGTILTGRFATSRRSCASIMGWRPGLLRLFWELVITAMPRMLPDTEAADDNLDVKDGLSEPNALRPNCAGFLSCFWATGSHVIVLFARFFYISSDFALSRRSRGYHGSETHMELGWTACPRLLRVDCKMFVVFDAGRSTT